MIGTTMNELKDMLLNNHEIEFIYNNSLYSIEPNSVENKSFLEIWKCDPPENIAKSIIKESGDIDILFSIKCFDGKSFNEIENEVKVETIF